MVKKITKKFKRLPLAAQCTFCFTILNFLQRGINVIITPIMTRIMSTSEYSMYSVYTAWADILVIFATLYLFRDSVDCAILKCKDDKEKNRVIAAFQGLSGLIALMFLGVYCVFSHYVDRIIGLPHVIVLLMFVSFVFFSPLNLWTVLKRYRLEYKAPALVTAITTFAIPILSIIVICNTKYKGEARIVVYVFTTILVGAIIFFVNFKKAKIVFDRQLWKFAFFFNITLLPHYLSEIVLNHSDRIMINSLVGASETAIYAIAYSVSQLVQLFTQGLNMAFVPWQYQKIKSGNNEKLSCISEYVLIGVGTIILVMQIFAPEAIAIFAGSQYKDAVDLIPVISLGIFFSFLYQFFTRVEIYYEKKRMMSIASITAAICNVILNYILIKKFGYKAAGYTTLICYLLLCAMHYWSYRKICREYFEGKNYYDIKAIAIIALVMSVFSFVMTMIYPYTVIRYSLVVLICLILILNRKKIMELFSMWKEK